MTPWRWNPSWWLLWLLLFEITLAPIHTRMNQRRFLFSWVGLVCLRMSWTTQTDFEISRSKPITFLGRRQRFSRKCRSCDCQLCFMVDALVKRFPMLMRSWNAARKPNFGTEPSFTTCVGKLCSLCALKRLHLLMGKMCLRSQISRGPCGGYASTKSNYVCL